MSELTDFLLAQIAADEAVARAAIDPARPGTHWRWAAWDEGESIHLRTVEEFPTTSGVGDLPSFVLGSQVQVEAMRAAAHIARHDPARVLAECAAKRAIVEACREDYEYTLGRNDDTTEVAEEVLYALASVYAGADGWREEWAWAFRLHDNPNLSTSEGD